MDRGLASLGIRNHRSTPRTTPLPLHRGPLPPGYLHTSGAQILDSRGRAVHLAGVNWYGFDCSGMVPGGLDHQPLDAICLQIVTLGFNSVRLPFCDEAIQSNPPVWNHLDKNPALRGKRVLEIMDAVIAAAGRHGLKVILDHHRSEAGWSTQSNGLWYTRSYPEATWIETWTLLVRRYAQDPTVIGCDLRNEPGAPPPDRHAWPANGGALWACENPWNMTGCPTDWVAAAQRAGNAILGVNPNLLIFVEGVRYASGGPAANGGVYWPGGNLTNVAAAARGRRGAAPIVLDVPNRLVYSAHDYGPDMYRDLPWGRKESTQRACNRIWDATWGYLVKENIAPVWLGEWGTVNGFKPGDQTPPLAYTDTERGHPQGIWFTHLVNYLSHLQGTYGSGHWCYWCLNGTQSPAPGRHPSKPDWYGILDPTWSEVASAGMMAKLRTIQ